MCHGRRRHTRWLTGLHVPRRACDLISRVLDSTIGGSDAVTMPIPNAPPTRRSRVHTRMQRGEAVVTDLVGEEK
jgi:hypothetical protein